MKKEFAICVLRGLGIIEGRIEQTTKEIEVEVMARAGKYAMVRCKGASPFVAAQKDLRPKEQV